MASMAPTAPKAAERRQAVRFAFYKLDNAWRRLSAERQASSKLEFGETIERFAGHLLLRPYGLVGMRGDSDFLLWQVAEELDALMALQTALNRTDLGAYLTLPYSYLAMTRRSIYEFPGDPGQPSRLLIRPSEARYLFVYPFIKTRAWYMLPKSERQTMMEEHVRVGRKYPSIRLNTTYSYGLDDQEFIVAFEGDSPADFLDLVMELRESKASSYTLRDTPTFTCVQMSLWDMLDTLGGAGAAEAVARRPTRADGYTPVATLGDLSPGASRRVYAAGEAVALFNVDGVVHAISNRCTHARASLSEGTVDARRCAVTCPWHEGVFSLVSGQVLGGPPAAPVAVYRVKLEGDQVLIAPAEAHEPTVAPSS
jgi:chlorite dismutase/nitrite reductase/ring-hydroxylating ferredoxin subunit